MWKRSLIIAVTISASFSFGQQLDSNSVTVSANRNTNLPADQVVFGVYVDSGLGAGFNDVLAVVASAGITAANFSGVGTAQQGVFTGPSGPVTPAPMLEWAFALPVPISKTKDTVTALTSLQQSVARQNNGLTLSFSIQGTQVSQQSQQSQTCSIPDLLADTRAQAQKLADAAGQTLGPILAMSSGIATTQGAAVVPVSRLGLISAPSFTLPAVCSLTVKFGLTRY